MQFLKKYNLSDEDIKYIIKKLDCTFLNELSLEHKRTKKILDYLVDLGFKDVKSLVLYYPLVLYMNPDYIKQKVEANPNIINLLNEDIGNMTYFEN